MAGGSGGGPVAHNGGVGTISSTENSAPAVLSPPSSNFSCPTGGAMFSVTATGSEPISYRWQIETAPMGSNVWADLSDGAIMYNGAEVGTGAGAGSSELTFQNNPSNRASFRVRCALSNECGTVPSTPATYSVCAGDFTCDSLVDDEDFSIFVSAYNILDCADPAMPAGCPSDINGDGLVDDSDFSIFVVAYNALLCG